MRRRTLLIACCVAMLGATACQVLMKLEREEKTAASLEAGVDAGVDSPAMAFDPCGASMVFPPRPPNALGEKAIVIIVRHAAFTASASATLVCDGGGAYDLDGLDTCNGDPGAPARPCAPRRNDTSCSAPGAQDLAGGRDNALAQLVTTLADSIEIQVATEKGRFGLMFAISGYSGGPDDGDVSLDVFVLGPSEYGPPTWDHDESWTVDSAGCLAGNPGCEVSIYKGAGYVSGGVLFAKIPHLLFPAAVGGEQSRILIPIDDATLTGVLRPNSRIALELGRLVGRVGLEPGLAAVGHGVSKNQLFCEASSWPIIRSAVCESADLPGATADPNAKCESLSAGISFEGWKVVSGPGIAIDAGPECSDASAFKCDP